MSVPFMWSRRVVSAVSAGLLAATALAPGVNARVADTTEVRLFSDTSIVGSSSLLRTETGVQMTLGTTGLPAGHVVTVWFIVFNPPEFCQFGEAPVAATGFAGTQCGAPDLGIVDGLTADPRVDPAVVRAAGRVTGPNGAATFAGHLSVGDTNSQVLIGSGLTNPLGAHIHLVVHDHDSISSLGNVGEEIRTFGAGPGADLQFAAHE